MSHRKALLGGLAGAAAGAIVWAVVVAVTGYEVGWIAWAVGGMVGYGVAWGNRDEGMSPKAAGVLAVGITIVAIGAGKYLAVRTSFPADSELIELLLEGTGSDEYAVSYLADEVVEERVAEGHRLDWPLGVDPSMAAAEMDYPPDVWREAEERWTQLSPEEKEGHRASVLEQARTNITENLPEIKAAITRDAYLFSFGLMDLIFFGLAVSTAFSLAGGKKKTEKELAAALTEAVKRAMLQVAAADGEIREEEIGALGEVFTGLTGVELSEEEWRREIQVAETELHVDSPFFKELAPALTDQGKALILSGAARVAASDDEFHEGEKEVIYRIAADLGIGDEDLKTVLVGSMEGSPA